MIQEVVIRTPVALAMISAVQFFLLLDETDDTKIPENMSEADGNGRHGENADLARAEKTRQHDGQGKVGGRCAIADHKLKNDFLAQAAHLFFDRVIAWFKAISRSAAAWKGSLAGWRWHRKHQTGI